MPHPTVHDNGLNLRKLDPQNSGSTRNAAARGINDGDMVLAYNDRGQVKIPAKITDRVAKGVTTLSPGHLVYTRWKRCRCPGFH